MTGFLLLLLLVAALALGLEAHHRIRRLGRPRPYAEVRLSPTCSGS